jgi:hypothetical protein
MYQLVIKVHDEGGGIIKYFETLEEAQIARAEAALNGARTYIYKFYNAHVGYVLMEGE